MNMYDELNKLYSESKLYNNEFADYEDDFSFWQYWVKELKPKNILEIGIGNGRLTNLLSPLVSCYDGIELSENIIYDFNQKYPNFKGKIYNQDMRKIDINNAYDLIIIPFNTFVYLYSIKDIADFFKSLKKVSNDKTIIIIDIFNPSLDDLKDVKEYKLCNSFKSDKNRYLLYEKHSYNPVSQIISYQKKYCFDNKELEFSLPVRVFFHQEFLNLILMNGFEIVQKLGDYNNEEFSNNSRKQIIFIKRGVDDENF